MPVNDPDDKRGGFNTKMIIGAVVAVLVLVMMFNAVREMTRSAGITVVPYSEFVTMLEEKKVDKVQVDATMVYFTGVLTDEEKAKQAELPLRMQLAMTPQYQSARIADLELLDRLKKAGVDQYEAIPQQTASPIVTFLISWLLPMLVLYGILWLIMRSASKKMNSSAMSFGKNTAKIYGEKETGIAFKDVAGQEEAKESMMEIIDFLKNPDKYAKIGARMPKGALLVGPPGTGKTLLAKAVAGEAGVPFFAMTGSDFVEMFVGMGASRVRDLFKQAEEKAPCIVFIDEIDAIGKSRGSGAMGGNDEREQTLNQLLAEMDGFDSSKGVVILAATNRPEVLDPALLRPGRFDRRIVVDKPDLRGRIAILQVHVRGVSMAPSVDLDKIAKVTPGAVGADLANMINEGALRAVGQGRDQVEQEDLMEAVETVIAGKEKKDRILIPNEKRLVAVHESGHAMAAYMHDGKMPVQKITIVPRTMGSLGYVLQTEEEERYLFTKEDLYARLVTLTAGRAAEELFADVSTTGAANDIEKATAIARSMITQYGMSDEFGMVRLETQGNVYLNGGFETACAPETAARIDKEVQRMIGEAHAQAKAILDTCKEKLLAVASVLIEKETLTGEEFMQIVQEKDAPLPLGAGDVSSKQEA